MNTQPQLLPKYKKLNSLQRRLESWLINYQGTLPIDAQLCFEQLGLEYTQKNYKKFYQALWETNNCPDARVSFRLKDFYFAEFPTEKENLYKYFSDKMKGDFFHISYDKAQDNTKSEQINTVLNLGKERTLQPFDVLQSCYKQLAQLSKEDAEKILQSLTIML